MDRRQRHKPDAVREDRCHRLGKRDGEARLADAAGAGQGQETDAVPDPE